MEGMTRFSLLELQSSTVVQGNFTTAWTVNLVDMLRSIFLDSLKPLK